MPFRLGPVNPAPGTEAGTRCTQCCARYRGGCRRCRHLGRRRRSPGRRLRLRVRLHLRSRSGLRFRGRDVGRALHRVAVHRPHRAVVGVQPDRDLVRAARDEVRREAVVERAEPGDEAAVHEEVREPAPGHRPGLGAGGREAEGVERQPYVPTAPFAVRVRLDLYGDLGRLVLVDLPVVPPVVVGVVENLAHRGGRYAALTPVPGVAGATGGGSGQQQDTDRRRGEQGPGPWHARRLEHRSDSRIPLESGRRPFPVVPAEEDRPISCAGEIAILR